MIGATYILIILVFSMFVQIIYDIKKLKETIEMLSEQIGFLRSDLYEPIDEDEENDKIQ